MRWIAVATGAIILAAVTHVNIEAGSGYGTPVSWLMLSVAGGVGVSAFVFGYAWNSNRRWLAAGLVLAVAVGEFFNLTATAERLVAGREASQAPLRAGQDALEAAAKRVVEAKAGHEKAKVATSKRLDDAKTSKAAADKPWSSEGDAHGCVSNCRQLLQKAVEDAAAEVAAARAELTQATRKAEGEMQAAQAALTAIDAAARRRRRWLTGSGCRRGPRPIPLRARQRCCQRAGVPPHRLRRAPGRPVVVIVEQMVDARAGPLAAKQAARKATKRLRSAARDHARRFGMARLCPSDGAMTLSRIRLAYQDWADAEEGGPLPDAAIAPALAQMFAEAGIEVDMDENGRHIVIGVALKEQETRAIGPM